MTTAMYLWIHFDSWMKVEANRMQVQKEYRTRLKRKQIFVWGDLLNTHGEIWARSPLKFAPAKIVGLQLHAHRRDKQWTVYPAHDQDCETDYSGVCVRLLVYQIQMKNAQCVHKWADPSRCGWTWTSTIGRPSEMCNEFADVKANEPCPIAGEYKQTNRSLMVEVLRDMWCKSSGRCTTW